MEFPDPKYRDICSSETVHSSKQGFFSTFYTAVVEHIGRDWIHNTFAKQKLEEDKIKVCYEDANVWSVIKKTLQNIQPVYREKSAEAARESRLEGERLYRERNYRKAALLFTQSIIRAPTSKKDKPTANDILLLPLAYKWRANVFYQLQMYKECLIDLNLAIKEGILDNMKHEIYHQMGVCYTELQDDKKGKISLQVALKMVKDYIAKTDRAETDNESKDKIKQLKMSLMKEREEIKLLILEINSRAKEEKAIKQPNSSASSCKNSLPVVSGGVNEKYPRASDLITIKQNLEAGRFAVAARNILTGDTLVVEEPYASCLIPEMFSSHCHHCYSRLIAAIPCITCSGVAFCSIDCRDIACSTYHKYECTFLGLFIGSGMSVLSFLSLRMITQENVSFFRQLHKKVETIQFENDNVQLTAKEMNYVNVYNLVSHSKMRLNEDYFRRTLMALFFVKCLKKAGYFENETEDGELSRDEILTASLILRLIQVLQFNAHEIYETRVQRPGKTKGAKSVYIAVGIYPTVALFNHECSAGVTRYFHGKNIVIRAIRPIKKGEIVSENYGPVFTKRTFPERIRELTSRYWFKCDCDACYEDWPKLEYLTDENFRLRCTSPDCTGLLKYPMTSEKDQMEQRCPKCFNKIKLTDLVNKVSRIESLFEKGMHYMDGEMCEKAVPFFLTYLDEMHKIGAQPCRGISLCQEALRTCYAQTGNLWICDW